MEQTNVTGCKFILMTYEGDGNHYYDTTFNLRVPFRPNSNGQYKVTFNEIMFRNNEATLLKDVDKLRIFTYTRNEAEKLNDPVDVTPYGTTEKAGIALKKDIYTYYGRADLSEIFKHIAYTASGDVADGEIKSIEEHERG